MRYGVYVGWSGWAEVWVGFVTWAFVLSMGVLWRVLFVCVTYALYPWLGLVLRGIGSG